MDPKKTPKGKPETDNVRTEIGTAWVQLKNRDGRLANGSKELAVYVTTCDKQLPDRYMAKVPPEGNWVDNGKKLLFVDLTLRSTVHVTGKLLHSFLINPYEARHITGITGEDPAKLIQHLPLIINGLLGLISSDKTIPKQEYRPIENAQQNGVNNNVPKVCPQFIELSKSDRYADSAFSTLVSLEGFRNIFRIRFFVVPCVSLMIQAIWLASRPSWPFKTFNF